MAASGMMFLQRGLVVVTDRLHGHILSDLCGTPHVIFDPVNKRRPPICALDRRDTEYSYS